MKTVRITINGKEYPCRMTMGAFLRYKRETGEDFTKQAQEKGTDTVSLVVLMWCCIASASKHDGVDFSLSLEDFADSLDPRTATEWFITTNDDAADDTDDADSDEKKS